QRRANHRADARETLRSGLDLAVRCGAGRTAERAREELAAAGGARAPGGRAAGGGRSRREVLRGVDALTPSERRVAAMAAEGMTNTQIAQALFVTVNTIETHMRHVFTKLGIHQRAELKITGTP